MSVFGIKIHAIAKLAKLHWLAKIDYTLLMLVCIFLLFQNFIALTILLQTPSYIDIAIIIFGYTLGLVPKKIVAQGRGILEGGQIFDLRFY